jgi:hypothetical protein
VQELAGEGEGCLDTSECGPGLICRIPHGSTTMSCEQPVCNDGRDDDDDGKMDYPADPGCATPDDSDETDDCPTGPNCPACANGQDDDGDGNTDYPADPSCSAASGASEACQGEQDPILAIVSASTPADMTGAHDDHNPSCGSDGGLDRLFTLKVPALRSLQIDTEGTPFDTLLSLMSDTCTEPSIACDDDSGTSSGASRIIRNNVNPSTFIVAVDAYSSSTSLGSGMFQVHVSGVIQPGGACNPEDTLGGAFTCPAANPCGGPTGSMICLPSACGDGMDNDGDGHVDYPEDPGCSSLDDTDESDTCPGAGPGCPECADGVDNDSDGQTDYPNDTNCTFPGQTSEGCPATEPVTAITTSTISDTTTGATDDVHPSCASSSNTAPDHTFSLELPAMKRLTISSSSNFSNSMVLFDSTCAGTALACTTFDGTITKTNLAPGNYFLVNDGYSTGSGTSTITVSGIIQNGGSCESPLAQSGAITCGPGFACQGTTGSRTCRPAACNDGLDNDGDGVADYPNDPGCSSTSDTDETDTCPGTGCPVCSDGIDNDADGQIDYPDDPSCGAASGTSEACAASEPVVPLVLPATPGTTVGATSDEIPSCGSSTNTAGDLTYSLTIPAVTSLTIDNVNNFDAVVELYNSSCGGSPVQCRDTPETIQVGALPAGTYYYVVDGYSTGTGTYTINVSGSIAAGESCESPLAVSGALTCGAGFACKGTMGSRTCQPAQCNDGIDNDGDGKIDYPNEPGCDSTADDDETDPATLPACSNTTDDDGDSLVDYPADYGCNAASGTTEEFCTTEVDPIAAITMNPTTGTTVGLGNNFTSTSCQSSASGPDTVLALQLPVPVDSLVLDLSNSSYDTILTLRDTTCGTQIGCDDDSGDPGAQSKLTVNNVAAGNYAVVIDGWNGNSGTWTLSVTGTVAAGTSCTSPMFAAGILVCPTGTTCTGSPATCQ